MNRPETKTTTKHVPLEARFAVAHPQQTMRFAMTLEDSTLPAEIEALCRDPIVHNGRRAMTTELLAVAYGTDVDKIHDNHRRYEDRFVDGTHYVRLVGDELKAFKNQPANRRLVANRAAHLILWLDRGAARHAKLIDTDEAWDVFGKLEDAYFDQAAAAAGPAPAPLATRIRDAVTVFSSYRRLARMIGLDKNQAAISANQATMKRTGENVLADLGSTHMLAPEQSPLLTPSQLGERLGGLSGKRINLMLAQAGLQAGTAHVKGGPNWEPTPAGAAYAKWMDTGKKHGDGAPVQQLKWTADVLALLGKEAA